MRSASPWPVRNTTSSLPKGFYKVEPGYTYGDIVAFDIPEHFRPLVQERGWSVEGQWFLNKGRATTHTNANLFAEHAVFLLRS